ncbi:MAG: amino acid permease [Acidobacteria bacterium]|nr:amino acid permease [Acidobacteriota bacterium]
MSGTAQGPSSSPEQQPRLLRKLTLLDATMLLVSGVIGSAIFLTSRDIAAQLPTPALFLGVWAAGGAISLLACFAFAELGAMYPEAGGQYIYLREAYGDIAAFLFGWMYFGVIGSGTIAALSVACAQYAGVLLPVLGAQHVVLRVGGWALTRSHLVALAAGWLLTLVNILGVKRAAIVQNIAGWMKYAAMAVFVVLGFLIGKGASGNLHVSAPAAAQPHGWALFSSFGVALIAVLWAYDGWIYVGQAAGEVKNATRNVPLALIAGILLVAAVYMAMNAAYLYAMPLPKMAAGPETVASEAAGILFSPAVGYWIAGLVAVSCFGALSANILSAARVSYAMAEDRLFFRRLANIHPRWHTPVPALVAQCAWGSVLTLSGRYDQIFTYIMFVEVIGYALTVVAVFVLRRKAPERARPYRCTGYPWLPALYVVCAAAWAGNTLWARPVESLSGIGIIAIGVPFYLYWRRAKAAV